MAEERQPYRFGWIVACLSLGNSYLDAEHAGVLYGLAIAGSSLATGLAAALVRPWGWYVLLLYSPSLIVAATLYFAHFGKVPSIGDLIPLLLGLLWAILVSGYFYRRRAMFGARWRWKALERSFPRMAGPESYEGPPPGIRGLSIRKRLLFLVLVLVIIGLGLAGP